MIAKGSALIAAFVLLAAPAAADAAGGPVELVSAPTGLAELDVADVFHASNSADGSHVWLFTDQKLTLEDGDNNTDVYERSGGVTRLVSAATGVTDSGTHGVFFAGASADGKRVFIQTSEQLTADDLDTNRSDVYERFEGVTRLVSQPTGVVDPDSSDASFVGASADGGRVFILTNQKLTGDDNDTNRTDVYERSGGATTLVSQPTGTVDPDTGPVGFAGASLDGTRVFLSTTEKLTADDNDTSRADVYQRAAGVTTLVSQPTGLADPDTGDVDFSAASKDGSRVFVRTAQKLTTGDLDTARADVYERSGGTTTLLSAPTGLADPDTGDANLVGTSDDGSHVFMQTAQKLTSADTDTARTDIYERAAGVTTLVSQATGVPDPDSAGVGFEDASADGSRVLFESDEKLTSDDTDDHTDVFERSAGATKLISQPTGVADPASDDIDFDAMSEDGARVFFVTSDRMTVDDNDTDRDDVYERFQGVTTLVSRAAPGLPAPDTGDSEVVGNSADGRTAFVATADKLTADDTDTDRYDTFSVGTPPDPPGVTPDLVAPELTAFAFKPRRFRKRTNISFNLSEAARVRVTFEKAARGRRVRGRCRKQTRRNRGRKRCTRYVRVKGSLTLDAAANANTVRFSGRVGGRRLRPGAYRAVAVGTDEASNASEPARARFTVLKKKKKRRR